MADQKAEASPEQIFLLGDSAEVSLFPTITRCWTRIGQQRVILTPGVHAQKRWNWGAVNPVTGQTVSVIHHSRNNVGFRRLLAAISRAYELPAHPGRKVVLFVDNDQAHKAKAVSRLLEKHENRIQLEWLPSYSPELNAQEDIWQHMRRRVTHNHYFEHMDTLLEAVDQFNRELEHEPEQVLRLLKKWSRVISS
jgi:transposase